jgi:hypothetical protein
VLGLVIALNEVVGMLVLVIIVFNVGDVPCVPIGL